MIISISSNLTHDSVIVCPSLNVVLIPTLHSLPFSNDRISFSIINPIAEILLLPGEKCFFCRNILGDIIYRKLKHALLRKKKDNMLSFQYYKYIRLSLFGPKLESQI